MRRDERIMRFLSIVLDKFGVKYNEDKRNGLIRKTQRMRRKNKPAELIAPIAAKIPEILEPLENLVEEDEV